MILPSRLGCPLSLKTPNMGNPGQSHCTYLKCGGYSVRQAMVEEAELIDDQSRGVLVGGKVVGQASAVLLGLDFDAGKGGTLGLGLDDDRRLLVHVEKVVGGAVARLQGELAHRYSAAGVQVDGGGRPAPTILPAQAAGLCLRGPLAPGSHLSSGQLLDAIHTAVIDRTFKALSSIGDHRAHGFGQPRRHHGAGGRQLLQVSG